jgi:hypothetical protein
MLHNFNKKKRCPPSRRRQMLPALHRDNYLPRKNKLLK